MLWLKNIVKTYVTGGEKVDALKGVNLGFRDCELVAVLGPSGCGKTTLLNIIGGLDRYSSGDLSINGRSTKEYSDADWDSYRNHSIGFVFQTYNLIPHQTVLANVELALTLSGVGRAERRKRAADALRAVGLGDQLKKKPNQMSGGQMQRVAIARALVNNPDILLADEPTGALDTETSIQVMDILREVAKDRLVIMVTHNPELAEKYATRTVRLLDGNIISDTDPVPEEELAAECEKLKGKEQRKTKKTSMSFGTALSLSLNNLLTKKARTILTSFAGSIGIIGIALILSMSSGFQNYINRVQEDILSTYPMEIKSESMDISKLMSAVAGQQGGGKDDDDTADRDSQIIHTTDAAGDIYSTLQSQVKKNDIAGFYNFIKDNQGRFDALVNAIQYSYKIDINLYNVRSEYGLTRANPSTVLESLDSSGGSFAMFMQASNWDVFSEMIDNEKLLAEQYDVVSGRWPSEYNEVVLVIGKNNGINVLSLYTLGILDQSKLADQLEAISKGEAYDREDNTYTFDEIVCSGEGDEDYWSFNLVINSDYFRDNGDGTFTDMRGDADYVEQLAKAGEEIKVVGIIRPSSNSVAGSINGAIAYTSKLTDHVIEKVSGSAVIKAQTENTDTDIFTGKVFRGACKLSEKDRADGFIAALPTVDESVKASLMKKLLADEMTEEEKTRIVEARLANMSEEERTKIVISANLTKIPDDQKMTILGPKLMGLMSDPELGPIVQKMFKDPSSVSEEETEKLMIAAFKDDPAYNPADYKEAIPVVVEVYGDEMVSNDSMTTEELAEMFDEYAPTLEDAKLAGYYNEYCLSAATYSENVSKLSVVDHDEPDSIYIYPADFSSKEKVMDLIDEYNSTKEKDEDKLVFTDFIGIIISSISTVIDAISYILIGFVSISLVVSSIMIGVITYISVLERTKEIGILRSIGASKRDVRTVFNAETFIVGAVSGIMGITITLLLIIPLNAIIASLAGISNMAMLPMLGGVILIAISVGLTVIAGLIPSGLAAKRDPVVALRTE